LLPIFIFFSSFLSSLASE